MVLVLLFLVNPEKALGDAMHTYAHCALSSYRLVQEDEHSENQYIQS